MALESSVGISTIPIPVGRTAPCGRIIILQYRSWRNGFSKGRSRTLRGSLASCWKGHGVQFPWLAVLQTYLSALFSFQRAVGLSACETYQLLIGFHRLTNFNTRTGKRENVKSCPWCVYFISTSKFGIISIIASRISPFNSMSMAK